MRYIHSLFQRRVSVRRLAIAGAVVLLGVVPISRLVGQRQSDFMRRAEPYTAPCGAADLACVAWKQFRLAHPYPYQVIQGARLADGSMAIIVSEPPPLYSRETLDALVRSAFGPDLKTLARHRWRMGVDGWLEDLVLQVESGAGARDPLEIPLTRDRIAFLHLALFGTAFGAGMDVDAAPARSVGAAPPSLEVSPADLRAWLADATLRWKRLDGAASPESSWSAILGSKSIGAFGASDRSLVLLAFPGALLKKAPSDPNALNNLRAPFRCFAVATDSIVGVYQDPGGQVAIVGRSRTQPFATVPPLRFETFQLVAAQSADQLSQSYERGSLFAGKLLNGDYILKDWAPIFLSEALVDTEFGALLNTTDQLLKSWSEAGSIEYLYFNYPQPQRFPFGLDPLSAVIRKLNGGSTVLFNWNTSGSGVIVSGGAGKTLTVGRTGALPVTYGSELAGSGSDDVKTGHLLQQEEEAYRYFASQRDPNLERVVEYTMLYQFCRAVVGAAGSGSGAAGGAVRSITSRPTPAAADRLAVASDSAAMKARRAGAAVRVAATARLLASLRSGDIELDPEEKQRVEKTMKAVRAAYPYTDQQLAAVAADRFSPESTQLSETRQAKLMALARAMQAKRDVFVPRLRTLEARIDKYNAVLKIAKETYFITAETRNALATEKAFIDSENVKLLALKGEIDKLGAEYDAFLKTIENDPLNELRLVLAPLARRTNLEQVRHDFVEKHAYDPGGSIKTPSVVISWNTKSALDALFTVGGHDVSARALRFERSAEVADIALERTKDGPVLRYNPARADAVEANAGRLARAVEHRKVTGTEELAKILQEAPPRPPRTRVAALELRDAPGPEAWRGKIGSRVYTEKSRMVDDLSNIAEQNSCCVFIAQDREGVAFATERNLKPPPAVIAVEIRDSASMTSYLSDVAKRAGTGKERPVVFLDAPKSHVEAATMNVTGGTIREADLTRLAKTLGERGVAQQPERVGAVALRDLKGRESTLNFGERLQTGAKEFFQRFARPRSKADWGAVEISSVDQATMRRFIGQIPWDASVDGVPNGVVVKFGGKTAAPMDMGVVTGYTKATPPTAPATIKLLADRTAATAALKEASMAEYAVTLRNELLQRNALQLRRLTIVVKHGETTTLLTLRWDAPETGSGGRG